MRTRRSNYDANAVRLESKRRELKDKQFRKTHEDGNSYFSEADVRPDPYHSSDTPCCRLGLQVLEKLFPEIDELGVVEKKAEVAGDANADSSAAAAAARGDAGANAAATRDESTSDQSIEAGPSKDNDGKENTSTGGQEGEQAMELMALLIRTHLLEERKRARGDGMGSSGGGNAGGKKKKKKKKRKKGAEVGAGAGGEADAEAAATPVEAAASTAASGEANGQGVSVVSAAASLEDDEDGNNVGGGGDGAGSGILEASTMVVSSSSPSGVAQISVSSSSSPQKSAAAAEEDGNVHVGASITTTNESSAQSPLDSFLDQILQSTAGRKGGAALPANRDLASFVEFLNARYRIYLDQKQEQSSGPGGRKKKTDHHRRTFDSTEVLPTISYRVLERQAENPACSKCRTGSTTKVYSSSHEGTEQVTHSFTITGETTAWPPNEDTAQLQHIEALIHSDDGIEMSSALDYVALEEGHGGGFVEEGGYGGGGGTNSDRERFRIRLEGSVPLKSSALRDIRHYERKHPALQRERPEFLAIIPPRVPEGENPQVLSLSDIICLVTQVLVPGTLDLANWVGCAPNGVGGVNEDVYSNTEYRSVIEVGAKNYYESSMKKLKELESLRDTIVDEGSKVRAMQENTFRPNEARSLRSAEAFCDSYLEKATVLLEKFTQISLGVCCEDTPLGKWARGVIQEFMDKIDMVYSESVQDVTTYQRKIGERFRNVLPGSRPSCDNFGIQGAVPEYRDMVNKKIDAISNVHSALEEKLLSQSSIHPNLTGLQCFCAASIYYTFREEIAAAEEDQNESLRGSGVPVAANVMETVAKNVRKERQTMCCTSWREVTCKENLLERKRKATIACANELDRFEVQLDTANIYVNDVGTDANAFTSIITRLTKYENLTEYRTRTCQEENDADWFAESAEAVVGHHNQRATVLLLKWWLLRLRRYKKSQPKEFALMPRERHRLNDLPIRYVKWVEKTFSNKNIGKAEDSDPCPGYGRDRRVACLIAAMLYGWLQDRCVEWNAELRQKEILAAMENDEEFFANDPSSLEKESSKSSKKKKKKGKKKAGAGASTDASNGPDTIVTTGSADANTEGETHGVEKNDSPTSNEEEKDAKREREQKPPSNSHTKQKFGDGDEAESIEKASADNGGDFISVASTKKTKGKKKEKKGKMSPAIAEETSEEKLILLQDQDGVEEEVEQVAAIDSNALQFDYVSRVAVQDGKELIPVEYFLVRRLRTIMSQAKANSSGEADAKRPDEKIVFL